MGHQIRQKKLQWMSTIRTFFAVQLLENHVPIVVHRVLHTESNWTRGPQLR